MIKRPKPVSQVQLTLFALILLWGTAAGAAIRAGVVRLPILDRQDIRFSAVSAEPLRSEIRSIARDRYGFLWLGGHGLHRYDGYGVRSYWHDAGEPRSLSDDTIMVTLSDRAGILWVGTAAGGLDRLDPALDSVTHNRHDPADERSLIHDTVSCLYEDSAGVLWVGTNGGLDRRNANGSFTHFRHDARDTGSLSSDGITSLFEDRSGTLWVGTVSGLNRFERKAGRFSRFLPNPVEPQSVGDNYVKAILEDHAGAMWVSAGNWLRLLDVKTGKFTDYSFHAEEPGTQRVAFVTCIQEDADGVLWLGTVESGLLKLDRERKAFSRYTREPGNANSLPSNLVSALFEDAEGVMWAGTDGGLARFPRKAGAFVNYRHETRNPQSLPDDPTSFALTDREGFLWIAGTGGLSRVNRRTGQFTNFRHREQDPQSLPSDTIFSMLEDRSGTIWLGSYGAGLNRFDRKTGRFLAYRNDPHHPGSLASDLVLSLLEDRQGTLWVGTQGGGFGRFDASTGHFTGWRHDPKDPHSLTEDHVSVMAEDHGGFLWLGTQTGLNRFDPRTQEFAVYLHNPQDTRSLSDNKVNAIREDHNGTLWVGTENGLNRRDDAGGFTHFTMKNGLPDNKITSILEDGQGNLWLATNRGISRFHPPTGTFRNYSESDGLPANYLYRGFRSRDGELLFCSANGLTSFYPDQLAPNPYVPPVMLTSLSLFNKPVQAGADSPLRKPIWATDTLTLSAGQSIFTLEFAGLSYAAPEKNRYRYRLEGLETEWNEVGARRRLATYTSLAPGGYVFRVQASNNDALWNEKGAALAIRILPPWWATWWFRSLGGLGMAGLALAIYRSRVGVLRAAAARLEVQVAERTCELVEQTRELQIAKDAADAANRAKTTFLANMSHELRTPLNAILGFTQLMRDEEISEKQRTDLEIINRSGEHLLHLINDVLDVAKIEAGRGSVENAPCNLTRLVSEVMDMMRVRAEAKGLQIRVNPTAEFPDYVRTDAAKLRQILINLLGNAIKCTETGSVTVHLDSGRPGGDGRIPLALCIEDTGVGIAQEDRERIFEPFVQLGNPAEQNGTGLGLTITLQFVKMMGGVIQLESALGKGSRFRVELPVAPAQEFEAATLGADKERIVGMEPGGAEYRILIVDDSWENRAMLERLLHTAGFPTRVAAGGAQAITLFRSWRPHFIWMDLRMPGMDGTEATRHIRALEGGGKVKIVAVSASVFADQREELLAAGLDDFVHKPFRPDEIFDCMARHLEVRYRVVEGNRILPRETAGAPRLDEMAMLPEELLAELRESLIALDVRRIARAIERVGESDRGLGEKLKAYAGRLAFTAILEGVDGCRANSATSR